MNREIAGEDRYTDAPPEIAEEIRDSVIIPDNFPLPEELKRDLKRTITIRLDPDVYTWFQLPGPGYQTRINAVLREYVKYAKTANSSKQLAERGGGEVRFIKVKAAPKGAAAKAARPYGKKSAAKKRAPKAKQKRAVHGRARAL